jgi:hypothetical protein
MDVETREPDGLDPKLETHENREIERRSAVGFGAVQDGVNVERAGRVFDEADAVVANAQSQLASVAFELLDVALAGAGEAIQCGEDAHGAVAVDAAHIGALAG